MRRDAEPAAEQNPMAITGRATNVQSRLRHWNNLNTLTRPTGNPR